MSLASLEKIAELLGGEVRGNGEVLAPGPGHTSHDRSLSVRRASGANGFPSRGSQVTIRFCAATSCWKNSAAG